MSELEEIFDPRPTSVKEYLRIVIAQNENFSKDVDELKKEVERLKKDLERRNTLAEMREKRHNETKWVIGVVAALAAAALTSIIDWVLRK